MCWNTEEFSLPALFSLRCLALFPKDFVCFLWLGFIKVILMVNIKKVNIIVFVFHFQACWPLNSSDRLLCFWQHHGNLSRPLTLLCGGLHSCSPSQAEAAAAVRLARRGWREGRSRLPADVFLGAHGLFNKRMWNINLPSPLHCIICEVMHEVMLIRLPVRWGTL